MNPTEDQLLLELLPRVDQLNNDGLGLMVKALEALLTKVKEKIDVEQQREVIDNPETPKMFYRHLTAPAIDSGIVEKAKSHLMGLSYTRHSKNSNRPEIFLYGSSPYIYNQQSAKVQPTPIEAAPVMAKLMDEVNSCLGANFNSMLVNKYRNYSCYLPAHKDDEDCLDPVAPIATLSLGATRRLRISDNKKENGEEITLTPSSIFCMDPGFQERFHHEILPGQKKKSANERGIRFSITFRHVISSQAIPPPLHHSTPAKVSSVDSPVVEQTQVPDVLVFGSSLTKGLDVSLLSKHTRQFKVYPNSGAHVKHITNDVKRVAGGKDVTAGVVKDVFFVCGGNNIENMIGFDSTCKDFRNLVGVTREAFPNAKLHLFSLIPRRSKYKYHIRNMLDLNEWLEDYCSTEENVNFINVWSFFLTKTPTIWPLNKKLFGGSLLHFNKKGDSVLGKVLIGVANFPK